MDSSTGKLYVSANPADFAEMKRIEQERPGDLVQIVGSPAAIANVSAAVKAADKAKRKRAKASRKRNRCDTE